MTDEEISAHLAELRALGESHQVIKGRLRVGATSKPKTQTKVDLGMLFSE